VGCWFSLQRHLLLSDSGWGLRADQENDSIEIDLFSQADKPKKTEERNLLLFSFPSRKFYLAVESGGDLDGTRDFSQKAEDWKWSDTRANIKGMRDDIYDKI